MEFSKHRTTNVTSVRARGYATFPIKILNKFDPISLTYLTFFAVATNVLNLVTKVFKSPKWPSIFNFSNISFCSTPSKTTSLKTSY
jgi:hypothetical protein